MQHVAQYLECAREAESKSAAVMDLAQKKQWLAIANGYRNLAQARQGLIASVTSGQLANLRTG